MEGEILSDNLSWTASRRQNSVDEYIRIIKACFRRFPESFHYYQQLIEYLGIPSENRVASTLQVPKVFEVIFSREYCNEGIPYFPFRLQEGGSTLASSLQQRPGITINILEGFPSPDCIASLGSRLSLRPELFIGNLDLGRKQRPRDVKNHFEPPAPPSLQDNIVHIQLINLVRSLTYSGITDVSARRRAEWQNSCRQSEMDLFSERKYGFARFRRLHIHNLNFFSLEQKLSFSVCRKDDGRWEGVFLSDNGRSLTNDRHFPWSGTKSTTGRPLGSLPILAYNFPYKPSSSEPGSDGFLSDGEDLASSLDQFHPLKTVIVTSELDHALLTCDPFFVLSGVLNVANLAWAQLISYLADDIAYYRSSIDGVGDGRGKQNLNHALEQLRFDASLLERTSGFLSDNLVLIKQGGTPSWPKPLPSATTLLAHKAKIQTALERDVEHLMARCKRLAKSCELSTTFLVSSMQLIESQKAINQAGQVQRLTQIAFLFIPISLVATVFGMNVAEFENPPKIWVFLVIAGVILGMTGLVLTRHLWVRQVTRFASFERKEAPHR